ncbi:glycosyltransferase involved in cell wall biosynthesis [Catenulispora sp. MAP5-51]|uniref:glycosyltransferase n=1 Tax=Catenulispora sp. MAP5-51 TaxID=3156298 RepID=UPI003516E274
MTTTLTFPGVELRPVRTEQERLDVVVLSTYPPRQCGIGAFAADLYKSLDDVAPDLDVSVCAVDREGLRYDQEVAWVLDQRDPAAYRRTAADLAAAGTDAVLIQHEFGIYGGTDGALVASFASELSAAGVPYLVTLHSVPAAPTRGQADVLRRLCRGAAAATVLSPTARRLAGAAGIRADRWETIAHGAPEALHHPARGPAQTSVRPEVAAMLDELAHRTVVSTFGLLSPDKGLETAIAAVADLARDLPDLSYVIAGATHPDIVRRHGERYRDELGKLVAELGAADRVRFLDFFLTHAELAELLAHTTVFLTPYRSRDRVSSGALTYALAAGRPVVSTSFFYAQDMLSGGAGLLAEPGDAGAYAAALRRMLTEPGRLARAEHAAAAAGTGLLWPVVAHRIAEVIRSAVGVKGPRRLPIPGQR